MGVVDISVVVPLFNEEESAAPVHRAISEVMSALDRSYEIIFVDDGSKDRTFEITKRLAREDPHLRVIRFRRNCGQTPAMVAGIDHARGDIVITMDGDLQNDATDIPLFIEKIEGGFDIVVGWRYNRQDKLITRVLPSIVANWMISQVTGVPIKDNGCSLKAYRGELIKSIPLYSEMHRFIPAMMSLAGVKIAEIKVKHHARKFGMSKYGLSRIYRVLLDLLFIRLVILWCERPILSFSLLAGVPVLIGLFCFLYAGAEAFIVEAPTSFIMFGLAVLYGSLAIFLVALGLLGQLIYESGTIKIETFALLTARVSATTGVSEVNET
jgi:glycosyltransferase involved in cell wall biosynthesis